MAVAVKISSEVIILGAHHGGDAFNVGIKAVVVGGIGACAGSDIASNLVPLA